jgi:hypothetical protein
MDVHVTFTVKNRVTKFRSITRLFLLQGQPSLDGLLHSHIDVLVLSFLVNPLHF